MTTISIDEKLKCLSEQFYSYNRVHHSILISLLNVPKQLKEQNKCGKYKPKIRLIDEVISSLDNRYNKHLRKYTDVSCLTLELKLTRTGTELGFEADEFEEFEFYENDIKTVYRLTFEETEQLLFGFEVEGLTQE